MATSGKDTGIVGYNVQAAVDTEHHLIVAHEVTNFGNDRHQLTNMAKQAREELGTQTLEAVADRGYYEGGTRDRARCEPRRLRRVNSGRTVPRNFSCKVHQSAFVGEAMG